MSDERNPATAATSEPAPPSKVRRFFAYPLVVILIGFVLFAMILNIGFSVLAQLPGLFAGAPNLPTDGSLPTDPATVMWWGFGRLIGALILAVVGIYSYRFIVVKWCEGRSSAPELAFTPRARKWTLIGILLSFGVIALTLLAVSLFGDGIASIPGNAVIPGIAASLGLAIFAGVVEELFARGTLFRISEQHIGTALAIILASVIFGVQHADNPDATLLSTVAVALEGGAMLCAVYVLARTLWAAIAVHFAWNFGQSILGIPVSGNGSLGAMRLQLNGPDWLTGGSFGIEPSAVALVLWTLVTIVLLTLAAKKGLGQSWRLSRANVRAGGAGEPVQVWPAA